MNIFSEILSCLISYSTVILSALFLFGTILRKKKHSIILLSICLPILLVVPEIINYCTDIYFWVMPYTQLGWYNFSFLIYWFLAMSVFYFAFETTPKSVLFYGIAAYTFQNLTTNLRDIIRYYAFHGERGTPYKITSLIFLILCFLVYYFLLIKRMDQRNPESTIKNSYLIAFLTVTLFTVNIYRQYWAYHSRSDMNSYDEIEIYGTVFSAICTLVMLVLQFGLFEESKLKKENKVIEQVLSQSAQQKDNMERQSMLINMKYHDLKRQINALRTIEDNKEREETIQNLEQSVQGYDLHVKTGNKTLDVLLSNALSICVADRIEFSVIVNGKSFDFIKPADLYSLFSNAIDNAIECVRKYPDPSKRQITVHSHSGKGILELSIENYCEEELEFKDGIPLTTSKEDKDFHGFGTKSIQYIVEKYNGIVQMSKQNSHFTLNIVFLTSENP